MPFRRRGGRRHQRRRHVTREEVARLQYKAFSLYERNRRKRFWKRVGAAAVVLGLAALAVAVAWRVG